MNRFRPRQIAIDIVRDKRCKRRHNAAQLCQDGIKRVKRGLVFVPETAAAAAYVPII